MMDKQARASEILKDLLKAKTTDEIDAVLITVEPDICKEIIKMLVTTLTEFVFIKFMEKNI